MMNGVYVQLGVGPAGSSLVLKTIQPGRKNFRPFCPEVYLAEWDRIGLPQAAEIVGEMLLRILKIYHVTAFAPFAAHLTPPTGDESLTYAQIVEADRSAEKAEKVTPLAPFTFDGDMREPRLAVGVTFDNRALRLVPMTGEKQDGVAESIPLDALDVLTTPEAWGHLGKIILQKVAAMHPHSFQPFDSFASLVGRVPC